MPSALLFPLSQGQKWGLGHVDGRLILFKSKLYRTRHGKKERRWWLFPYVSAGNTFQTKSELFRAMRQHGIRLTKRARIELNDLPEKFVDWPSWYRELD